MAGWGIWQLWQGAAQRATRAAHVMVTSAVCGMFLSAGDARGDELAVFAAASLADALAQANAAFETAHGHRVTAVFAASSTLARQIEYGAPADLFISANPDWMDHLAGAGAVDPATRVDLLSNRLVVIAHEALPRPLDGLGDLPGLLGNGRRIALALTEAVPAGQYARAALEAQGVWPKIADLTAQTDNVRAALVLVERGEAPFGIVYSTDALAAAHAVVVHEIDPALHPAITYPMALTPGAGDAGRDYHDWLQGEAARAIFAAHGFGVAQ